MLQRTGCDVLNPAGRGAAARCTPTAATWRAREALARRNIVAFEAAKATTPIVVNAAGCGAMLQDYAHHLRDDPTWAATGGGVLRRASVT